MDYTYDDLGRLLVAANANVSELNQSFSYDLAGNLLTNSALGSYGYPVQGASAVRPHAVTTAGAWSFSYDANGNQTADVTNRTAAYGGLNQPPSRPVQSVVDSALDPMWGDTATRIARIDAPEGVTIFEGAAAAQRGLIGGGNQVFIQNVDLLWVVK